MQALTPQGRQRIEEIAQRYGLSVDAVMTMLEAVSRGGGTMAQFSHPELGGSGQWMQGGMTMVGDMFNHALKAKVDNLCRELAELLTHQPFLAQAAQTQRQGGYSDVSLFVGSPGNQWWPSDLGTPSSTGSQNNLQYAIFPASRRLAIDINGQVTVYDTQDHQIGGVGQQQGPGASFTFTSQYGLVRVADLPVVSGQSPKPELQTLAPQGTAPEPASAETDIYTKIERLAELTQKGLLSEAEFVSKKAELLSRV